MSATDGEKHEESKKRIKKTKKRQKTQNNIKKHKKIQKTQKKTSKKQKNTKKNTKTHQKNTKEKRVFKRIVFELSVCINMLGIFSGWSLKICPKLVAASRQES